jgi:hypothetical protein
VVLALNFYWDCEIGLMEDLNELAFEQEDLHIAIAHLEAAVNQSLIQIEH